MEIDQDLEFQRRSWVIQRIGWVLMALVVVAAAVGLLGSGPLSRARGELPGLMTLEYERFARFQTTETLTLRLEPPATDRDTVRVSLSRAFLDSARMDSVLPPPVRVEAAAGRLVYVFSVAERRVPLVVTFTFEPQEIGRARGRLGLETAATVQRLAFRQLVYP